MDRLNFQFSPCDDILAAYFVDGFIHIYTNGSGGFTINIYWVKDSKDGQSYEYDTSSIYDALDCANEWYKNNVQPRSFV